MKKYLSNIALFMLNDWAREQNLDISNTVIEKEPRKQLYTLVKKDTKERICSVLFSTYTRPKFFK